MNLNLDAADVAFRDEVREFLAGSIPDHWRTRVRAGLRLDPIDLISYQRRLAERGWGAPTWPVEHGGTGWTPAQQYIFWSEAAAADAPAQFHQGLELIGPIIFTYGTAEQKARYLPRILTLDDWWCQGYSEPGAGSDLAALRTRADRDGDHYVLNGQKMWTSYANVAQQCFVLARTSQEAKRQQGISLILVDMATPGLRVAPIATMDEKYHTNELFLDDVRVPVANLVGEEGQGWSYGKVLLDRERMVTASTAIFLTQTIRGIRDAATRRRVGGVPLIDTPSFASKLAQLEIEVTALQAMVLRLMDDAARGADSGPRGSMVKLRWSQLTQEGTALWMEAIGPEAAHFAPLDNGNAPLHADMPYAVQGALYARVTSIYGGTSEIQHNIIARRALGLEGTAPMDFAYTDEQAMLRDSVDRYGQDSWPAAGRAAILAEGPAERRRRWREMAELGWLMLPIDADRGGLGGGPVEVMAVMEGIGRHLMAVPYASSCVLAPALLAAPGEVADGLLEEIGSGEAIAAAALLEADGGYDLHRVSTVARRDGGDWRLSGVKTHVEDGGAADWFVVSGRSAGSDDEAAGIGLFLVAAGAPGLTVERFRAIDSHHHCRLRLDGVPATAVGEPEDGLPVIEAGVERALAAHAAEATGSMEAAAAATLDYLKTRRQFGEAIGSFQVLQHRMVDMTLACEEARSITYNAMLRLDRDPAERRRAVAAAKVRAGQSGIYVGQQAVQLHGGVGFSDELIVSHHLRRQMMLAIAHGSIDHHRARFAATIDGTPT